MEADVKSRAGRNSPVAKMMRKVSRNVRMMGRRTVTRTSCRRHTTVLIISKSITIKKRGEASSRSRSTYVSSPEQTTFCIPLPLSATYNQCVGRSTMKYFEHNNCPIGFLPRICTNYITYFWCADTPTDGIGLCFGFCGKGHPSYSASKFFPFPT